MDALLRMMEQMLGIGQQDMPSEGESGGDQPGEGGTGPGLGDATAATGEATDKNQNERTVPRAAGSPPETIPPEYRSQLESFHRALDQIDLETSRP